MKNKKRLIKDPLGAHDDAAYCLSHQHCSGESSSNQVHQAEPTAPNCCIINQEFQTQSGKLWTRSLWKEPIPFLFWWQSLNGTPCLEHVVQVPLPPPWSADPHLLWTFFFIKINPSENVAVQWLVVKWGQSTPSLFTRMYGQCLRPFQIWRNML